MMSTWPKEEKYNYDKEEVVIEKVKDIIEKIRNVRSTKNIHPSRKS